jgi:hypothetical protein
MGELGAVVGKKTMQERLAKALTLTLSVINMRQKEETNLVLGEVEVEVGTWELGLDDVLPEPVHRSAIGDVR